ncbi:MAG: ferrochelatase [Candidatus Melainabacteria bacterium]|nr:ferrochelatase [Candidatus Melainabacteria bacterium]
MSKYDALLIVSFGGPEAPDDVIPFLENVLRGRNVPPERMVEVAKHYEQFGGVSPINEQNRALMHELKILFAEKGPHIPIYWGNRNWHPMLDETIKKMAEDGVRNALAFVTSAYSSYSGCRQYRENIEAAREKVGPNAPFIDKLRIFFNHPGFVEANVDRLRVALNQLTDEHRKKSKLVFTAHSIPTSMAAGCGYESQLRESGKLIAETVGHTDWELVFQSRSGPATQPWLVPDICDYIEELSAQGYEDVIVQPIGFVSDHLEVKFDLDKQAMELAESKGVRMLRAGTAGTHPAFINMIRELVLEKTNGDQPKAEGEFGLVPEQCSKSCCPQPTRPTQAAPERRA